MPASVEKYLLELAQRTSIEVTPNDTGGLSDLAAQLGAGTRVYLPSIPGTDPMSLVHMAESVRSAGLTAVPHIAARSLHNALELANLVSMLTQVGVTDLMLIAGSAKHPLGSLDSSLAVLESGVLDRPEIRRVDVAGHPEGNPDVSDAQIVSALEAKQRWASGRGVDMSVVSQFAFQADVYVSWAKGLRRQGIDLPVIIGLPGLAKTSTLVKYGIKCGVGPSLKMLRKQGGSMLRLAGGRYTPHPIIEQVAEASFEPRDHNIVGLHFFPFGAQDRTARYISQLRSGRFDIDESSQ